jgi:hypothetical protein
MTKTLTIALFSVSMIALSATSSFAQEPDVRAGSHKATRQEAVRPLPQSFRDHFAAMPTANRADLQIDYARPPAQPAQ